MPPPRSADPCAAFELAELQNFEPDETLPEPCGPLPFMDSQCLFSLRHALTPARAPSPVRDRGMRGADSHRVSIGAAPVRPAPAICGSIVLDYCSRHCLEQGLSTPPADE